MCSFKLQEHIHLPCIIINTFTGYKNLKLGLCTVQSTSKILSLLQLIDLYQPQCFS